MFHHATPEEPNCEEKNQMEASRVSLRCVQAKIRCGATTDLISHALEVAQSRVTDLALFDQMKKGGGRVSHRTKMSGHRSPESTHLRAPVDPTDLCHRRTQVAQQQTDAVEAVVGFEEPSD